MIDSIRRRLSRFLDVRGPEADFLEEFLSANLQALRKESRAAMRHRDWAELRRYALAVLALGENLQFPKLCQAGRAMQDCIQKQDVNDSEQVLCKTNMILRTIEKEQTPHERSSEKGADAERSA